MKFKLRMTIWLKELVITGLIVVLQYCVLCAITLFLIRKQLPENEVGFARCPTYNAECFGSWKMMVADWHWFYFLQQNIDKANVENVISWINWISQLDPHFTSAYRLGAVHLLFNQHNPTLTISLIEKSFSSPVNAADWRMYGYLIHAYSLLNDNQHVLTWKKKLKNKKKLSCSLLCYDLPEQPDYLTRSLES